VGYSTVDGVQYATEWSGGNVTNLGSLPGFTDSEALSINDVGHVVGFSEFEGVLSATEWIGSNVINLGGLSGSTNSDADAINNAGVIVGSSTIASIPEPSTWAMMLAGFAGLGFAGYRRAKAGGALKLTNLS
jgi:uncharacterized membrane protein